MSSCCNPAASARGAGPAMCPASNTAGNAVELLTVKSLLRESALGRLAVVQHYFCPDPACNVVYFDAVGAAYSQADLRVSVWEKHPAGARTVCYCFGENEGEIRREVEESGSSDAVARVRAHIKAGRCACEIRNPRGVCCLGDVIAAVERVRHAIAEGTR
ncbi:MAG: putative iron-sulfur cluster-binding metallochaperone [Vicinamibacterales bacterium]